MVLDIADMENVEDLCVFRGGSVYLDEQLLSKCLKQNTGIKVLLLWQFTKLHRYPELAGAMRAHPKLERITITLPHRMEWGCMDLYAMGFAEMPNLRVLQIRCQGKQEDAIITPEASAILFSAKNISSLYLENVGLLDDHIDVLAEELTHNHVLTLLDLKDNMFTDDALYTIGRALPKWKKLCSLDVSGCTITPEGGEEIAKGISQNTCLTHLELEGNEERYQDEFRVPVGHANEPWMKTLYYHLRLNRAQKGGGHVMHSKARFVEALNAVSDQLDCIFYFIRGYAKYCDREGKDTNTFCPKPVLMWHDENAVREMYCS